MLEQHTRTAMLITQDGIMKLKASKVIVFGLGGVGSYCVEALARVGVGKLVLVDFDDICPSNINRQLLALHSTLGRPKVEVMRDRILDIDPEIEVECQKVFFGRAVSDELLTDDLDYIVDAIDTVTSKIDLILEARNRGIPVISCMGAGNKLDPAAFQVADISRTSVCPLAKVMRRELRKAGIEEGVKVVFSLEPPLTPLQQDRSGDACSDGRSSDACSGVDRGSARRSVPGSISFVPSAAGLILAGEVVRDLIGRGV